MPSIESWLEADITHAIDLARRYGHKLDRSAFKVTPGAKLYLAQGRCETCEGSVKIHTSRAVDLPTSCKSPDLPWKW